jgi:hypothetical protein
MTTIKIIIIIISFGKDAGEMVSSHTVGGNVNWSSHCGNQCGSFLKN